VRGSYGRTAYNGVLLHNDRVAKIQKLMSSHIKVEKIMDKKQKEED